MALAYAGSLVAIDRPGAKHLRARARIDMTRPARSRSMRFSSVVLWPWGRRPSGNDSSLRSAFWVMPLVPGGGHPRPMDDRDTLTTIRRLMAQLGRPIDHLTDAQLHTVWSNRQPLTLRLRCWLPGFGHCGFVGARSLAAEGRCQQRGRRSTRYFADELAPASVDLAARQSTCRRRSVSTRLRFSLSRRSLDGLRLEFPRFRGHLT